MSKIPNVGVGEKVIQQNGKAIVIIHPNMAARRKPLQLQFSSNPKIKSKLSHLLQRIPHEGMEMVKRRPSYSRECLEASEYYFEDGLRKVYPYFRVLETIVNKERAGVSIDEFIYLLAPTNRRSFLRAKLKSGHFHVNFESVTDLDRVVEEGDFITSLTHYHEGAVPNDNIDIIHETEDILVVNKPAGIPMYPQANYNLNSLQRILAKEGGYPNLNPIHRLDKNTSGVCIISKGPSSKTKQIHSLFRKGNVKKQYLALVDGNLAEDETVVSVPLLNRYNYTKIIPADGKKFDLAKEAETRIQKLAYDSETNTTLVKCLPASGRTHQIRQHLSQIGHPIVNDEIYNPHDCSNRFDLDPLLIEEAVAKVVQAQQRHDEAKHCKGTGSGFSKDPEDLSWIDSVSSSIGNCDTCLFCQFGRDYERHAEKSSVTPMLLHSAKYEIGDDTFEAAPPRWISDRDYLLKLLKSRNKSPSSS